MNIQFNQVLPVPLSSMKHSADSLWNSNVILEQGKKIVIEARSGRGKSTFIHLLFGIRKDYNGQILVDNKNLSQFTQKDLVDYRQNVLSVVFQDLQLFPYISVYENLKVKNDLTKHFSEDQLIEMLSRVGLADKINQPCGLLSMGQQQRVAIIRALCQSFTWIFMDEPFSHLDELNAEICMGLINEECEKNRAGWIITSLGMHLNYDYDKLIHI